MLSLGSIVFASPWILLSLVTLPIVWWILHYSTASKIQPFPPVPLMGELNARKNHRWEASLALITSAPDFDNNHLCLRTPTLNAGEPFMAQGLS